MKSTLSFTGGHFLVLCGRAVWKNVLHLQEFIGSVSSDDGETKALLALPQSRMI